MTKLFEVPKLQKQQASVPDTQPTTEAMPRSGESSEDGTRQPFPFHGRTYLEGLKPFEERLHNPSEGSRAKSTIEKHLLGVERFIAYVGFEGDISC